MTDRPTSDTGNADDLLTTRQVLDLLHISRTTLYAMMGRGELTPLPSSPVLKNPHLRFRRSDVERLLRGGE